MNDHTTPEVENTVARRAAAMAEAYERQLAEMQSSVHGQEPKKATEMRKKIDRMRERARRLIYTGDETDAAPAGSPGVTTPRATSHQDNCASEFRTTLQSLPPCALHRIEASLSVIRHSAVETCFYNLQLYAGMLASDDRPSGIEVKLGRSLAGLTAVRERIESFLMEPSAAGSFVADLFSEDSATCREALAALQAKAGFLQSPGTGFDPDRLDAELGREIHVCVERVTGSLAHMQARIQGMRIDIAELVQNFVETERGRLENAGVALTIETARVAGVLLLLDPVTLTDALTELLRNTLRHGFSHTEAPESNKQVTVRVDWADAARRWVKIEVTDNGRGINLEHLPHLGQRGYSPGSGSGEGLAMVRRVIEQEHLGRLEIHSTPGHGTTIAVVLPIKADLPHSEER